VKAFDSYRQDANIKIGSTSFKLSSLLSKYMEMGKLNLSKGLP